jgi:hypothetical protein
MGDDGGSIAPVASAAITSSISSVNRYDPMRSISRVMAREIATGWSPGGSRPTMTTRPPRAVARIAAPRPAAEPDDSIAMSTSRASIASALAAASVRVAPSARARSRGASWTSVTITSAAP